MEVNGCNPVKEAHFSPNLTNPDDAIGEREAVVSTLMLTMSDDEALALVHRLLKCLTGKDDSFVKQLLDLVLKESVEDVVQVFFPPGLLEIEDAPDFFTPA